ncbi:MAG: cobalt-precorrin-5B (C(1))-methyltransferase [Pseudomonadota bacterium]
MSDAEAQDPVPDRPLRRGWTTGTCAAGAAKSAFAALVTGRFLDPVEVQLPGGERPAFALATSRHEAEAAQAGIIKDAGDDPDVTHGALIFARVRRGPVGSGVRFLAGPGVGTVTRPGLPLPPGEPAINPVPRRMIAHGIAEVAEQAGVPGDAIVEIGIEDGAALALKTLNPRLGIVGGLSVLGTTGIVIPFSCAAWIHSIHRGIDVARAMGLIHVAGATGAASEAAVQQLHGLPETALIDMGDFVGGMLKYLAAHPVPRITVAGGVAKMTKLAQGRLDLHSKRGAADLESLAMLARSAGASPKLVADVTRANTVAHAFSLCEAEGLPLGDSVAQGSWRTAAQVIAGRGMELEVAVFDREGKLMGRAPFARA